MTNATNTTNKTSPVRGVMTYFMGAIAVLTCPCHLPILILLFSGTAMGAFLQENTGLAVLFLLPIFLLSAIATWRLLDKNAAKTEFDSLPVDLHSVPPRWRGEKPIIED